MHQIPMKTLKYYAQVFVIAGDRTDRRLNAYTEET